MKTLNELRDKIYANALSKGFYRDVLDIMTYIDKLRDRAQRGVIIGNGDNR